jgi:hypothetical protein
MLHLKTLLQSILNLLRRWPDTTRRKTGTTMADRAGLKVVGFIFATVTLAVMLTTVQVVKSHADGHYSLDGSSSATR